MVKRWVRVLCLSYAKGTTQSAKSSASTDVSDASPGNARCGGDSGLVKPEGTWLMLGERYEDVLPRE